MSEPLDHHAKGGLARAEALSPERRQEIAKAAAAARWGGRPRLEGPKRKPIPDGVRLAACLIALGVDPALVDPAIPLGERIDAALRKLGLDLREPIEWDHNPALGIRVVRPDGRDWEPPQHDPRHIVPLGKAAHKLKTEGKTGTSKLSITGNGDKQRAAKVKRIRKKEAEREATSQALGRALDFLMKDEAAAPGPPILAKPKRPWPKGRKLQSRNDLKRGK